MAEPALSPVIARINAAHHANGLLRFGAVGVFNVATEFTVFGLLIAAGVTPLAANACGFVCANGQSYLANARFTFRENGKGAPLSFRAYARFFAAHCAALAVSTAFLIALGPAIGLFEAKALAVGVSFVLNYAMSAAFVFGREGSDGRQRNGNRGRAGGASADGAFSLPRSPIRSPAPILGAGASTPRPAMDN